MKFRFKLLNILLLLLLLLINLTKVFLIYSVLVLLVCALILRLQQLFRCFVTLMLLSMSIMGIYVGFALSMTFKIHCIRDTVFLRSRCFRSEFLPRLRSSSISLIFVSLSLQCFTTFMHLLANHYSRISQ